MRILAASFLALLLAASPAIAIPSLIATKHIGLGGGNGLVPDASAIEAFSIELGYQNLDSGGTVCDQPRIGCYPISVPLLTAGSSFGYSTANSPQFAYVSSLLGDNTSQQLYTVIRTWGAAGILPLGSGSGDTEPFLHGLVPTLIRLKVNSFTLGPGCCGYAQYAIDLTWEFYGDLATPTLGSSWGRLKLLYR